MNPWQFCSWLMSLDEPGNRERATVTLTQIIEKARQARQNFDLGNPYGWTPDQIARHEDRQPRTVYEEED